MSSPESDHNCHLTESERLRLTLRDAMARYRAARRRADEAYRELWAAEMAMIDWEGERENRKGKG